MLRPQLRVIIFFFFKKKTSDTRTETSCISQNPSPPYSLPFSAVKGLESRAFPPQKTTLPQIPPPTKGDQRFYRNIPFGSVH